MALAGEQTYIAHNEQNIIIFVSKKTFVATKLCLDKSFVATSILLSQQKTCFVAIEHVLFVATKMILVAAPANYMYIECSNFSETFINNLD